MKQILEKIEKAGHIVVISHINPDADSLGSASAMYTFLLQRHKKVSWFCKTSEMDSKFSFLPWIENIKAIFPPSADLAISLDCANKSRLGADVECELINIDHHATNSNYGDINLVNADHISTTALLFDLFKNNGVKINKKMATALYAGVLGDSAFFMSERVDGMTFASVSELIALGADYKECNRNIAKRTSLGTLRLKAIMLKNMSLYENARVAFFYVSQEDMRSSGASIDEYKEALMEALRLVHVKVAIALVQESDFVIKGSLRSDGDMDVSKIAVFFGGGGHAQRAAFTIKDAISFEDVKNVVLNLIKKEL